jgi:hypothetical protein
MLLSNQMTAQRRRDQREFKAANGITIKKGFYNRGMPFRTLFRAKIRIKKLPYCISNMGGEATQKKEDSS